MSFLNITFPVECTNGTTCGPKFITNVNKTLSGYEFRNNYNSNSKIEYNIPTIEMSESDINKVLNFFHVCIGRLYSFRFCDITDYTANDQELVHITQNKYQLYKKYQYQDYYTMRKITKPKSVEIYINNILQNSQIYTINYLTGEVIVNAQIAQNDIITANFTFDIEMRFDTDKFEITLDNKGLKSINNIILIEV